MLADQFGVPLEHITILHGDTGVVKQGIGTFGSRSQAVGGTALHMAGAKVKSKMAKFAAALLEAHEDDLVFENGTIAVKGSPASGKSFASVAVVCLRTGAAPRRPRARLERRGLLRTGQQHLSVRLSHLDARDRPPDGRADTAEARGGGRCGTSHQPAHRRRTDSRRPRPGHRAGAD